MNALSKTICGRLHDLANKILFLEKKKIFKLDGVTLHPSEIHLILAVEHAPRNASQLAETLQITLGAVSQTITRLVKKGILIKERDTSSNNELILGFTPLGERIVREVRSRFSGGDKLLEEHLSTYDEGERRAIARFLDHAKQHFDRIG